jgi:hypothetical protein
MAVYREIEEVKAAPLYLNSGPAGWSFTLWNNSLFDEPHRPLLERFAALYSDCALDLPEYHTGEDCIEGSMMWQSKYVWVWYEHDLTHLSLWSADRDAIESLRAAILPLAQDA